MVMMCIVHKIVNIALFVCPGRSLRFCLNIYILFNKSYILQKIIEKKRKDEQSKY